MIVHTMSPAEVVQEAIRDLPTVWNKMKVPVDRLKHKSRVDPGVREKEQLVLYRSPAGNNWLVVMRPHKKVIAITLFVYYWCADNKLRAARICDPGISIHLSAHALEQYFNRFNRSAGAVERLKEFVKENMDIGLESCDEINELRCGIRHGYMTGVWAVKGSVMQITTFVDHGKLFPEQIEQMERLDVQRYESAHPTRRPEPGHISPYAKTPHPAPRAGR